MCNVINAITALQKIYMRSSRVCMSMRWRRTKQSDFRFFFNVITFDDVHGFVGNHFVRCWFMYWSDLIPVNISAFGKYQLVAFHLRRSFSHCIFVEVSEAAFSFLLFIPAVDLTYLRVTGFVFASKRAYRHYHIIMHCARKLDTNWSQKLLLYFLVSHRLSSNCRVQTGSSSHIFNFFLIQENYCNFGFYNTLFLKMLN